MPDFPDLPNPDDQSVERIPDEWESSWRTVPLGAAAPTLEPGDTLAARYRIDAFLDSGGMGVVYRATDLDLNVTVALKIIRSEISADPAMLVRFKREVLLARSISHPHVCRIYDIGRDASRELSFLTMEFLPGETLAHRLRARGLFAPEEALPIVRQLAHALDAAHRAGIVHRDLKASNVMLTPAGLVEDGERAVITDFGLAMAVEKIPAPAPAASGSTHLDQHGPEDRRPAPPIPGTPEYMAPEQVQGHAGTPASDLYSLGIVLFEMTTGALPFLRQTRIETARARVDTDPPRPLTKFGPLPQPWEEAILRLLSRNPRDRYGSGGELIDDLDPRQDAVSAGESDREVALHEPGFSIPAERDEFVGRDEELELLARKVGSANSGSPLVSVVGLGGTGKTRLVQRFAWDSLSRWPGGVWFCDLSEARSENGIVMACASALGVSLDKDDPVSRIGHAIAGRGECLLILDNFEQVSAYGDGTLGRWLDRCPDARFLVTSRERLLLPGEETIGLEPLEPATHGVDLFDQRARSHRPGFRVVDENRELVEEIVRNLDGLPLAIEMAASRLRVLSIQQLRDRLADRFDVLRGERRGRQATMEATLEWSWDLLSPSEQSALAQVSVFEGGFTFDAAEAVVDISNASASLIDLLQALVDKSWLQPRATAFGLRFEMFATVHEYASLKLSDLRKTDESVNRTVDRHIGFFSSLGSPSALASLVTHGGTDALRALCIERENLAIACRRAVSAKDDRAAVAALAAVWEVVRLQGPASAIIDMSRDVLGIVNEGSPEHANCTRILGKIFGALGNTPEADQHLQASLAIARDLGDGEREAEAELDLGRLYLSQGRLEQADTALLSARERVAQSPNPRLEAEILSGLGDVRFQQGQTEDARLFLEHALKISRDSGNRRAEGLYLGNLGVVYDREGRAADAAEHYRQAQEIHREVNDLSNESLLLANWGSLYSDTGEAEKARRCYEAALSIAERLGSLRFQGILRANLGQVEQNQGRLEQAREMFEAALAVQRQAQDSRAEGITLGNLGGLHQTQGNIDEAQGYYEAALKCLREIGDRANEGIFLGNLGILLGESGRLEEGVRACEESLTIVRDTGARAFEGLFLDALGTFHNQSGRESDARLCHEDALAIHRETGNRRYEGTCLAALARLEMKAGQLDVAEETLGASISLLREIGAAIDLGSALCDLAECHHRQGHKERALEALGEAEAIAKDTKVTERSVLERRLATAKDMIQP